MPVHEMVFNEILIRKNLSTTKQLPATVSLLLYRMSVARMKKQWEKPEGYKEKCFLDPP